MAMLLSCAILFLSSCRVTPELLPVADVLLPSEDVQIVGFTEDGNIIVNGAFMLWVDALKDEIKRLRKELNDCRGGE